MALATRGPVLNLDDLVSHPDSPLVNSSDLNPLLVHVANQQDPPRVDTQPDRILAETDAPTNPDESGNSSAAVNQSQRQSQSLVPLPLQRAVVPANGNPIAVDNNTWAIAYRAVEDALDSSLFKPETYPSELAKFIALEGVRSTYSPSLQDLIAGIEESSRFLDSFIKYTGPDYERIVKRRKKPKVSTPERSLI